MRTYTSNHLTHDWLLFIAFCVFGLAVMGVCCWIAWPFPAYTECEARLEKLNLTTPEGHTWHVVPKGRNHCEFRLSEERQ